MLESCEIVLHFLVYLYFFNGVQLPIFEWNITKKYNLGLIFFSDLLCIK